MPENILAVKPLDISVILTPCFGDIDPLAGFNSKNNI
jgi:hypothetical protein